jgi:hypothetical protein
MASSVYRSREAAAVTGAKGAAQVSRGPALLPHSIAWACCQFALLLVASMRTAAVCWRLRRLTEQTLNTLLTCSAGALAQQLAHSAVLLCPFKPRLSLCQPLQEQGYTANPSDVVVSRQVSSGDGGAGAVEQRGQQPRISHTSAAGVLLAPAPQPLTSQRRECCASAPLKVLAHTSRPCCLARILSRCEPA